MGKADFIELTAFTIEINNSVLKEKKTVLMHLVPLYHAVRHVRV